ncbi:MAG: DUF1036 domain-containing protein [Steroidobacter sp.]
MSAFNSARRRNFFALLSGLVFLPLTWQAKAWDSDTDSLRICNKNGTHDVAVAVASKAAPWGVAALAGAGWRREGWWTVKAGRCEHTMFLRDVQNYEIWLYVAVVRGEQVSWPTSKERFCLHPTKAFEAFAWSKKEIQACGQDERLETFSHITSLYNQDDAHSLYSVENRTIDLNFTYNQAAARPPPSTAAPANRDPSPRHPDIGKLVQTKIGRSVAGMRFSLRMFAIADPANGGILRDYADRLGPTSAYEMLICTYNAEIVNREFRKEEHTFWYNSVPPSFLELMRQLSTRETLARSYGVLAAGSCPTSLNAALELEEKNARAAAKLR